MRTQHNCSTCGAVVMRVPSAVRGRVFCSRQCTGKAALGQPSKRREMIGPGHSQWKGGRIIASAGYVLIWKPDHVQADKRGYVAEHRMIMSGMLGRPLGSKEHVHHINGNRADNRPENLRLLSASEHQKLHCGQDRPGQYPRGWAKLGHGCTVCETTSEPHYCRGMCRRCHHRLKARENRAKARAKA